MCVICRRRFPKHELARHVADDRGLTADAAKRAPGRGFYLCADPGCAQKFAKYTGWRKKTKGAMHGE
jgi:hypothetical protein